ncbi:MAG: sulfatase [Phycisphaeraceae bacterium]|nr:sulfatase [Phycisphaeraceae bacterium]
MKRRDFLKTAGLTVAGASLTRMGWASPAEGTGPVGNVVIIHVDDLGWRDLGCMGSPVYETPHIDELAAGGTLYTNAYAAAALCTPARACLLTGAQTPRHEVYTVVKNRGKKTTWKVTPRKNQQFLPKTFPTIGTVLTRRGIANGAIGKWHIGVGSPSHGFDEGKWGGYLGMPINYFAPFKLGFLPQDVPDGSYLPTYIRKAGVDFLERHKDEPFFLYFSTYLPHDEIKNEDGSTLTAPEPVVDKYRRKIAAMQAAGKDLQGHDNPTYAAMIEETDRSVGAIMGKLDELNLREKTLVVFISDNGGHRNYTSNQPLRGFKGQLHEGGIRVPMIASMPGRVAAGRVSHEPVTGLDLYPTICRFMNVAPTNPDQVDGVDLTPVLFEGRPLGERDLFWHFPCYGSRVPPRSVMRRGDWKIHHRYEDDGYELYNLKRDIGEAQDLAEQEPEVLARMTRQLHACYQRYGAAASLPANPDYDPTVEGPDRSPPPRPPLTTSEQAYAQLGLV